MKRLKLTFIFLVSSLFTMAQVPAATDARPVAPFPPILDDPMFYFWILLGSVLLFVIYTLVHSVNVLSKALVKETAIESIETAKVKKVTAWHKLMDILTRSVPVEQERDVLLDHDYDGIKELDNKLPPWWIWGFYITIIFAFVYIFYYHMSGAGKLMIAEYKEEMTNAALEKEERIKLNANYVTEENVKRLTDATAVKEGAEIFQKNCLACHGDKGQGNVGPNLTDNYWLHGGGIKNIFHTITEGVPSKGMISWKTQLSPKQIQDVASFIMTLEGSHPAGAKDPQGEIYAPVADSTLTTTIDSAKTDTIKPATL